MNPFLSQVRNGSVTEQFSADVDTYWSRKARILVLVDGMVEVLPFPPATNDIDQSSSSFGISVAIRILKSFGMGFSSFAVTVATRDGDGSPKPGHDITGFRFTRASLSQFDQIWMFGYWPGNELPNSVDPADDSIIENANRNPLSDDELAALAKWMDGGGGVFATGDHHLLGASMCHKVPRVSVMRAWTIADGVPTKEMETRLETTRPDTVEQMAGTAEINYDNELDPRPQAIEWVPFGPPLASPFGRPHPHPILCHPLLGPIDVLPDHMHEGRCYDFDDPTWQASKRDASFSFGTYGNEHFPTIGGARPLPHVLAWGTTPSAPPLTYEAGNQALRRFPQIAAYDGQEIGIGRVVVDSTWHHWFDGNLEGLMDGARETGNRAQLEKIFRYYVNVGIYLASPHWREGMVLGWLKAEQFNYFGREGIDLAASNRSLGKATIAFWTSTIGRCWVPAIVDGLLARDPAWPKIKAELQNPGGQFELMFEQIEQAVVGALVRTAFSDMDILATQIAKKGSIDSTPLFKDLDSKVATAARHALRAVVAEHAADIEKARTRAGRLVEIAGLAKAN